jgi:hypothetical protein
MIISEKIHGKTIHVHIESSNLKEAIYETDVKKLTLVFNSNRKYEYSEVPWEIFTKFRMAESQGKFFNTDINKKFSYKEVKEDDTTEGN